MSSRDHDISFCNSITTYLGRNGTGKCTGVNILPSLDEKNFWIAPINSKGSVARCEILIPMDTIPEVINTLNKMYKTYQEKALQYNVSNKEEVIKSIIQEDPEGVFRYLDTSTAHLPESDRILLPDDITERHCPVTVYPYECGWWIHVPSEDNWQEKKSKLKEAGFSPAMAKLIEKAQSLNCRFISLDCDAEKFDDLEDFEP